MAKFQGIDLGRFETCSKKLNAPFSICDLAPCELRFKDEKMRSLDFNSPPFYKGISQKLHQMVYFFDCYFWEHKLFSGQLQKPHQSGQGNELSYLIFYTAGK